MASSAESGKDRVLRNPIDVLTHGLPRQWRIAIDWAITILGAIAIVLAIKAYVVNLALPERRRVAVVDQAQVELRPEDGRKRALLGEPGERVRDEREDIDAQSRRRLATEA